jgi:hypothetical protein
LINLSQGAPESFSDIDGLESQGSTAGGGPGSFGDINDGGGGGGGGGFGDNNGGGGGFGDRGDVSKRAPDIDGSPSLANAGGGGGRGVEDSTDGGGGFGDSTGGGGGGGRVTIASSELPLKPPTTGSNVFDASRISENCSIDTDDFRRFGRDGLVNSGIGNGTEFTTSS